MAADRLATSARTVGATTTVPSSSMARIPATVGGTPVPVRVEIPVQWQPVPIQWSP